MKLGWCYMGWDRIGSDRISSMDGERTAEAKRSAIKRRRERWFG